MTVFGGRFVNGALKDEVFDEKAGDAKNAAGPASGVASIEERFMAKRRDSNKGNKGEATSPRPSQNRVATTPRADDGANAQGQ